MVQRLAMGGIEIDLRYRRVSANGECVELTPRVFALLQAFLAQPGMLLTREQLFARVWPGLVVEDANLSQSIFVLRRALGDHDRQIIRTVAKQGYVFEPTAPLVELGVAAAASAIDEPPGAAPEPALAAVDAPAAPPAPRARWRAWAAGVAATIALSAAAWFARTPEAPSAPPSRTSVAVLTAPGADAGDARVAFVRDWIEWRLEADPRALLVRLPEGAGAAGDAPDVAVFVDVREADGRVRLSAGLTGASGARDALEGPADALPQLGAQLAAAVVDDVLGAGGAAEPAPIDAATAQDYGRGLVAAAAHRPAEARAQFERAVARAPAFGPALLHLAETEFELGHHGAAQRHAATARAWAARLLPEPRARVEARLAELSQQNEDAARRYAALAQAHPDDVRFVLGEARALFRLRRVQDGLTRLLRIEGAALRAEQRLAWQLAQAEAWPMVGRLEVSAVAAESARALAAERQWRHAEAQALFLIAKSTALRGATPDATTAAFAAAAAAFAAAGDTLGTLRVRLTEQALAVRGDPDETHFDALLAQARADDNPRLEIEALALLATAHLMGGNARRYGELLERAAAVAATAGDRATARFMQAELAQHELLDGRLDAARERLELVLRNGPEGVEAFVADLRLMSIHLRRGEYARAHGAAERAGARLAEGHDPSLAALLRCEQGRLALAEGRLDDAERDFGACSKGGRADLAPFASAGLGTMALLRGERAVAERALATLEAALAVWPAGAPRVNLELAYAELLQQAGRHADAARAYASVLAANGRSGPRLFERESTLGLAECALAGGAREDARRRFAALRDHDDAADWTLVLRSRVLEAQLDDDRAAGRARLAALGGEARRRGDVYAEMTALDAWLGLGGDAVASERAAVEQRLGALRDSSGYRTLGAGALAAR